MLLLYIAVVIMLVVNLINPTMAWYLDSWKYSEGKPEPSESYILISRIVSGIALAVVAVLGIVMVVSPV